MTGINEVTMEMVAVQVGKIARLGLYGIHTVTVTLNGQHGGVDVIVDGTNPDGSEWHTTAVLR